MKEACLPDLVSMLRPIAALLLCASLQTAHAEVISIDAAGGGFLASSAPIQTLYFRGRDARALILFLPGGDGYIGLKPGDIDSPAGIVPIVKTLTDPERTRGRYDVVVLDSPFPLSPNSLYPSMRIVLDHVRRIESAIAYYRQKTGLPVWVMAHSNAGISVSALLKDLQGQGKTDLVAGMILLNIRAESRFAAPIDFPVLFVHHDKDACPTTRSEAALGSYEKVKTFDRAATAFVWIHGGEAQDDLPCKSGFHWFHGAGTELTEAIDAFVVQATGAAAAPSR
jgi:alpha/beta superfamily hydrolase